MSQEYDKGIKGREKVMLDLNEDLLKSDAAIIITIQKFEDGTKVGNSVYTDAECEHNDYLALEEGLKQAYESLREVVRNRINRDLGSMFRDPLEG